MTGTASTGTDSNNPPAAPPAPPAPRTFTQEEVNSLLAAEKRRLLAEQPDLTELREKARKFDEMQAASQTELERERAAREAAEKKAADAEEKARGMLRKAAITTAAASANAVDPSAVLALLETDAELSAMVTIGDDGQVAGVEDAVKKLLEAKPFLVGTPPPAGGGNPPPPSGTTPPAGGADGGARNGPAPIDPSTMSMEEYVAARKAGQIT